MEVGVQIIDSHLPGALCRVLLSAIAAERSRREAQLVERQQVRRSLRYRVIDGDRIQEGLPEILALAPEITRLACAFAGERVAPLASRRAAINVNILSPGGQYRWHYDRNAVTAVLYLNRVQGGAMELYPDYRLHLGRLSASRAQRWVDSALRWGPILERFGRMVVVAPVEGRLLLLRGDRCLHSVQTVEEGERINIVFGFDRPGEGRATSEALDTYLYSDRKVPPFDPNYAR